MVSRGRGHGKRHSVHMWLSGTAGVCGQLSYCAPETSGPKLLESEHSRRGGFFCLLGPLPPAGAGAHLGCPQLGAPGPGPEG
jgi:hypothetical protein